jgi:hypothetical protein
MHTSILIGQIWLDEILTGYADQCRCALSMSPLQFSLLWAELVATSDLMDNHYVTAHEQLVILMYWMVHRSSQQELQEQFQWSGDTIGRYINHGLCILTGSSYKKYIYTLPNETPKKILRNPKWYPALSIAT